MTTNVHHRCVAGLYRCRWSIEVFFKELKQTLQPADFPGRNARAVRWRVWTALLTHLLPRFCVPPSQWPHSFTRLFTPARAVLWRKPELRGLLENCGTAGAHVANQNAKFLNSLCRRCAVFPGKSTR